MSLKEFLKEEKLYPKIPEDLLNLLKKAVRLWNHLKKHKKDIHNRVKYQHLLSKIERLSNYYKERGELDKNWVYSPEEAARLAR